VCTTKMVSGVSNELSAKRNLGNMIITFKNYVANL
jgi:hypothetical protein